MKEQEEDKERYSFNPFTILFITLVCSLIGYSRFQPLLMLIGFPLITVTIAFDVLMQKEQERREK